MNIGSISQGISKIGANAYANARLIANKAKMGDTFKSKYAPKIIEKAKSDFFASKKIQAKTYGILGGVGAGAIAVIAGLFNSLMGKKETL